ncbi:MAG: alkaline phosphatase family protein [Planctomycetota bacterium]|jgi:phosphonoacetate hydrolase|nr:alkaline phosphatase family protein [Planctomycetota bacterium]
MNGRWPRLVVALLDGLGMDYYRSGAMPYLESLGENGLFRRVGGVFPSVTNVNNVSVCCGAWPDSHGITANSYYDRRTDRVDYMNAAELIQAPTLFRKAAAHGLGSALFTCKRKSAELFRVGVSLTAVAEDAGPELCERYGEPGSIYSSEINHWLWKVAADVLKTRPEIRVAYIHTTDYPMHRWAPAEPESQAHLAGLDEGIRQVMAAAGPDAVFLATADHGMNAKKRCWDLARVCAEAGVPVRFFLSPERDYYVPHHRNFTGCGWLYLESLSDSGKVEKICRGLEGVEEVIPSAEAARRYHLPLEQVGDLVVLGDRDTMFGVMDTAYEELPPGYRAHGSLHEMDLPLVAYPVHPGLPDERFFSHNKDLTAFLR